MKPSFRYDPGEAVAHLRAQDSVFATLIARVGPCTLEIRPTKTLFEALLRSIIYQQLHGNAAAAIHTRVIKTLGRTTPEALARASDTDLRAAGLSAGKTLAARDLAAKCLQGVVPSVKESHTLADDELIARLTAIRGIGPWTVQMLLIFYLGRPDILPTGDYAVRLAFKNLYRKRKPPTPAVMLKHARRWQPYRSVASWYLWRSLDTQL